MTTLPAFVYDFIFTDSAAEAGVMELVNEGPDHGSAYRYRSVVALADIPVGATLKMRTLKSHTGRFARPRFVTHESAEATAALLAL